MEKDSALKPYSTPEKSPFEVCCNIHKFSTAIRRLPGALAAISTDTLTWLHFCP